MEKRRTIRIICEYDTEIEKEIREFCISISNKKNCISLDLMEDINRVEYKFRGEENDN